MLLRSPASTLRAAPRARPQPGPAPRTGAAPNPPQRCEATRLASRRKTRSTKADDEEEEEEGAAGTLDPADKARALRVQRLREQINNKYGLGTVQTLDGSYKSNIETFSSGCATLDAALGGGYPKGRIVEIYGPESSGKTTLALHAVAEMHKMNKLTMYLDMEYALDPRYLQRLGCNPKLWEHATPETAEEAFGIACDYAASGDFGLIVLDSVSALVPKAELEGDIGSAVVGTQARVMSTSLRRLNRVLSETGTTMIFINQLRQKIGVMFGSNETTSGGNALKYYASQRIDIRKKETITEKARGDAEAVAKAIRVKTKVVKNKVAQPYREAMFDITLGQGIDSLGSLLESATAKKVVERRGAYYSFDNVQLGQGKEASIKKLREDKDLRDKLAAAYQAVMASSAAYPSEDDDVGDGEDEFMSELEEEEPETKL